MVARLSESTSLRRIFLYNEHKVEAGVARCLLAENYPSEAADLDEHMRLKMLLKMAELRPSVKTNALHISLNFDASEQLSDAQFIQIARDYMTGIGFGDQPYLMYRHEDAGHPHMHLVTTNIQLDGIPIPLHKLGIRKSEPIRKAIEKKYGLMIAEEQNGSKYELASAYSEQATYGKRESKKAISIVLNAIVDKYKYSSLHELNAVLSLYNVRADRGGEDSRTYKRGGLVYRILDDKGRPIGTPIKASAFYNKPTLKKLEQKFKLNGSRKKVAAIHLRNAINTYFLQHTSLSLSGFTAALKEEGISLVLRQNDKGDTYGITYVDHYNKTVFNGSDLGKAFSAKQITARIAGGKAESVQPQLFPAKHFEPEKFEHHPAKNNPQQSDESVAASIIEALMQSEFLYQQLPVELTGKKKKRHKKRKM